MFFRVILMVSLAVTVSCQCEGNAVAGAIVCSSCAGGSYCDGTTYLFEATCNEGQVCGTSGCIDSSTAEVDDCGCIDPSGDPYTGSYQDPYSASGYVNCSTGEPVFSSCADGQAFSEGECKNVISCAGRPDGSYPIDSSCTSYATCESSITDPDPDPEIMSCPVGTYFDILGGDDPCVAQEVCDAYGEEMVSTKCNIFYSCYDNSGSDPAYHCCPEGQNYDETIDDCVFGLGSCTRIYLNSCKEEEYENRYCKYCQNREEGDQYATYLRHFYDDGICTRNYYECVTGENGVLQAKLSVCEEGKIFYPESNLCENEIAHPGCTTISP